MPDQPLAVRVRGTGQREIRRAVLHRSDLEVVELESESESMTRRASAGEPMGMRARSNGSTRDSGGSRRMRWMLLSDSRYGPAMTSAGPRVSRCGSPAPAEHLGVLTPLVADRGHAVYDVET